jgi:hypothetical protein
MLRKIPVLPTTTGAVCICAWEYNPTEYESVRPVFRPAFGNIDFMTHQEWWLP